MCNIYEGRVGGVGYNELRYCSFDENVGYLVARKDGELVCYHFYDIEMVKSHLLDNTKFDTPASNKKAKMGLIDIFGDKITLKF